MSELRQAEELSKQELIPMLHHDCLHHPAPGGPSQPQRSKSRGPASTSNNAEHIAYLDSHLYQTVSNEELAQVRPTSLQDRVQTTHVYDRPIRGKNLPQVTNDLPVPLSNVCGCRQESCSVRT